MTPPFLFQITEMRQRNDVADIRDRQGQWSPPKKKGYNKRRQSTTIPDHIFRCNGHNITADWLLAGDLDRHYKTFSIYIEQDIFHIVNYDATQYKVGDGRQQISEPASDSDDADSIDTILDGSSTLRHQQNFMDWSRLRFDHSEENGSFGSYATYAGSHPRLRTQRPDQFWARRLLPESYHADPRGWTTHSQYGGMNGELPILLALVAFSVERTKLAAAFATAFANGKWVVETLGSVIPPAYPHGRE